jgi:short-subunit dehydrogenase
LSALITGASSGIGAAYARRLAASGHDLILVARRADRLAGLADELRHGRSIAVAIWSADLASSADLERLAGQIRGLDGLDLLVNNAGFGVRGMFTDTDLAPQLDMVRVHDLATLALCRAALPAMITRGRGGIVNVASTAAFLPVAGNAVYSASKAFLVAFSEALQAESARAGVRVQALCPGFTYTEFHDTPTMQGFSRANVPGWMWMSADQVVAASLSALEHGPVVVVPGWRNRLFIAATRFRPIFTLVRAVRRRWK